VSSAHALSGVAFARARGGPVRAAATPADGAGLEPGPATRSATVCFELSLSTQKVKGSLNPMPPKVLISFLAETSISEESRNVSEPLSSAELLRLLVTHVHTDVNETLKILTWNKNDTFRATPSFSKQCLGLKRNGLFTLYNTFYCCILSHAGFFCFLSDNLPQGGVRHLGATPKVAFVKYFLWAGKFEKDPYKKRIQGLQCKFQRLHFFTHTVPSFSFKASSARCRTPSLNKPLY